MLPLEQILDIMKRLDEIEKKLNQVTEDRRQEVGPFKTENLSLRGGTPKQSLTDKEDAQL